MVGIAQKQGFFGRKYPGGRSASVKKKPVFGVFAGKLRSTFNQKFKAFD
ncbi:hypothetical protein QT972_25575 [Microcoleus sp. herbarium7]